MLGQSIVVQGRCRCTVAGGDIRLSTEEDRDKCLERQDLSSLEEVGAGLYYRQLILWQAYSKIVSVICRIPSCQRVFRRLSPLIFLGKKAEGAAGGYVSDGLSDWKAGVCDTLLSCACAPIRPILRKVSTSDRKAAWTAAPDRSGRTLHGNSSITR